MNFNVIMNIILIVLVVVLIADKTTSNESGTGFQQIEINAVRGETVVLETVVVPTIKSLEKRINKKDVKQVIEIKTVVGGNLNSGSSDNDRATSKYGFERKDLYWLGTEGEKFPIGTLMWSNKRQTWKGIAYKLDFSTNIILQQDYAGTYETFIETTATHHNLKEKHGGGVYPVKINSADIQIKRSTEYQFSFWNPTIGMGWYQHPFGYSLAAKFNFLNYGKESGLPVYSFLSPMALLAGKEIKPALEIVSVNVGEFIPVIKDIHVGITTTELYKPFLTITSVF